MTTFIEIDEKAGAAMLFAAAIIAWAVIDPASFQNTIDTIAGALQGAIDGALAGAS